MKSFLQHSLLKVSILIVLLSNSIDLFAQQTIQPVSGNFIIQPPYSTYLSNYFIPGNERMFYTAVFNDFNEASIDVKLKVSIEGNGFNLVSKPNFATPITLVPGPNNVDVSTLEQYFDFNSFNASGVNIQDLLRDGALPEGFYTFKIEVLDLQSGRKISNTAIASARLVKNKPPLLTLPADESAVPVIDPQNFLLQWQAVSDASINTSYELTLVKIPENINANDAINATGTPILDAVNVNGTVYNYGATDEQLIVGNRYAWRVKAYDINNLSVFENDGLSQVSTFTYGFPPNGKIPLSLPSKDSIIPKKNPYFQWMGPSNAIAGTPITYNLTVVEVKDGQSTETAILTNPNVILNISPLLYSLAGYSYAHSGQLESGKKFAWQVNARVNDIEVATSEVQTFNTAPDIQKIYIGNHQLEVTSLSQANPNNLAGTGTLIIDKLGGTTEVDFSNLKVRKVAGRWVTDNGEIVDDYQRAISLDMPDASDSATFKAAQLKLNKTGLYLRGNVFYNLPFEADSSHFTTQADWMLFDQYELIGSLSLVANRAYSIKQPSEFILQLKAPSKIVINNNQASPQLYGTLTMPNKLKDASNNAASINFSNNNNLRGFDETNSTITKPIDIAKSGFLILPTKYQMDFSSFKSPLNKVAEPTWAGLYVAEYKLVHQFDENNISGLQINNQATIHNKPTDFVSLDLNGINLVLKDDYSTLTANDYANFKGLKGELDSLRLMVENNVLKNTKLRGTANSTVIGAYDFGYEIIFNDDSAQYSAFDFNEVVGNTTILSLDPQSTSFSAGDLLNGSGQFLVSASDTVNTDFTELKIAANNNQLEITDGEATAALSNFTVTLKNGEDDIDFKPTATRVDKEGLGLFFNQDKWTLPLATDKGIAKMEFSERWIVYDNYQMDDSLFVKQEYTFNLLDPNNFDLNITTKSYLQLKAGNADFTYNGKLILPAIAQASESLEIPMEEVKNIYSFNYEYSNADAIALMDKIGMKVIPNKVTVDLSENDSPGIKSTDQFWKGAYFTSFKHQLATNITSDGDFTIAENIEKAFTASVNNYFFVDNGGFSYKVNGSYTHPDNKTKYLNYHGFEGTLTSYAIEYENESFKNGKVLAAIYVPIMEKNVRYNIETSLTKNGFNQAVFTSDMSGKNRKFNSGKSQETTITYNKAHFKPNGDIKFDISLAFPDYKLNIANIDNFIYSGEGKVGFGDYNGEHTLTNQASGDLGNVFPFVATSLKAKKLKEGVYGFEVEGGVTLADNLAGQSGAIEGSFVAPFSEELTDVQLAQYAKKHSSINKFEIGTPAAITVGPVKFEAKFTYLQNDPDYGNCVQAYASASLKIPVKFSAFVKIVVGEKEGTNYWFAQAGASLADDFPPDSALRAQREAAAQATASKGNAMPPPQGPPTKDGTPPAAPKGKKAFEGIPLGPVLLTAFEGRVYHHMNHKADGGITDADYIPDPNILFGIYVKIGAIDAASKGGAIAVEGSVEATFNSSTLNTLAIAASLKLGNQMKQGDFEGTETTSSTIVVNGDMTLNIPQKRFTANIAADIDKTPICAKGSIFLDVSPTIFDLKLGNPDDMIRIVPNCAGFGGIGYVMVNTERIEVALGVVVTAKSSTGMQSFGPIQAKAEAEVGVDGGLMAAVQYNPEIKFLKAGLFVRVYASVEAYVSVDLIVTKVNHNFNLANIEVKGDLTMYFEPKKKLTGNLDGKLSLLDNTFKFNFSLPLNVDLS